MKNALTGSIYTSNSIKQTFRASCYILLAPEGSGLGWCIRYLEGAPRRHAIRNCDRQYLTQAVYRGRNNDLTPFCNKILHINSIGTSQRRIDTP